MARTRPALTVLLLATLLVLPTTAPVSAQPPGLPASYYGEIAIAGYTPTAETRVHVYLDTNQDGTPSGGEPRVASAPLRQITEPLRWVYSVDVPQDPCAEQDHLVFELSQPPAAADGTFTVAEDSGLTAVAVVASEGLGVAGTGVWSGGTNTSLNLTSLAPYGLTLSIPTPPQHGSASVSLLSVLYAPTANYCGNDALTFSVADRAGQSSSASLAITVTCVNDAPTALSLNPSSVDEGLAVGSVVGTLAASDVDLGDSHTFSLVPDANTGDNAAFQISGATLQTRIVLDHAAQSSYTIFVRAVDSGGLSAEQQFVVTVNHLNSAPTAIALSPEAVPENAPVGTTVGTLTASDIDAGDVHTFALAAGIGDADNSSFALNGGSLVTAATFDHELRGTCTVRIEADDGHGGTYATALDVTVTDVNEPPIVLAVPGQTITQSGAFAAVDLAPYASDPDAEDIIAWTHSGASALSVSIAGNVATIGRATPGWDGAEAITFTAADAGGLQGSATAEFRVLARQTIPLEVGWNLTGMSIIPQDPASSAVLGSIAGQYDSVYAWNAATGQWRLYSAEPGYPNTDLTSLDRSQGLWVHANSPGAVLVIDGIADGTTTVPIQANSWHLTSYPSGTQGALPGALSDHGLADNFTLVYAYHAEEADDPWKLYDRGAAAWANDLTQLMPGHGYWVRSGAASGASWSVTYDRAPLP